MKYRPTKEQLAEIALRRVDRLSFFANIFKGSQNFLIEDGAIQVLQAYRSKWGALWFHFKRVLQSQWMDGRVFLAIDVRSFWLEKVRRMDRDEIERRLFPEDEFDEL